MSNGTLSAHLAADRVVAAGTGLDVSGRSDGAVLFADLAGFTRLTEALAVGLGPRRGAEELSRHLDGVYDLVIAEVHHHGGAVVVFSGDAVTCWFDDHLPEGAAAGVHRATTCALGLQRALGELGALELPDGSTVNLSLKVAVAAGPAHRVAVGDPEVRLLDVLAGRTVDRTAATERAARPGEVVLDEQAARGLDGVVHVGEWRADADARPVAVVRGIDLPSAPAPWWESTPALKPEQARPWILAALRDQPDNRTTELRTTVALFVSFGDFQFDDDPTASQELDTYVRWVESVADRHGGTLLNVTLGDKGSYLYVAFGAPIAHEDQADRALACALELRDLPAKVAAAGAVAIGLDLGVTRTGAYGSRERHTFGVLGDATNVAARLMAIAAPGEILASERVRRACRQRIVDEEVAPVEVRGHEEPVAVVRVVGRPVGGPRLRAFGPIAGRVDELTHLRGAVGAVRDGPPGVALIEGDAGVGKSHLLAALRSELETGMMSVSWFEISGRDGPRTPLGAFLPLVRDLFYQDLADDPSTARGLFEQGMADLVEALNEASGGTDALRTQLLADAPFLGALLDLHWEDSPYERHDPTTRFERSLAAIDTLLRAETGRRPVVVHARDAHWLDEESGRVLDRLCCSAAELPLCVVIDRRPSASGWSPPDGDADGITLRLSLEPLGEEVVAEMAAALLGAPIDRALVAELLERTGGNALFVEQLLLDLRDRDAIGLDAADVWTLRPGQTTSLPATLAAVLVSRFDRLDGDLRRAVSAGAVLGERFDVAALASMLEEELVRTLPTIDAGVAAGIWHRDGDVLAFRHALVRDAAYEMQLDADLQVLHRRAARSVATATTTAPSSGVRSVECAYHEERAGRPARAAAHLRRAARYAARDHAYQVARGRFQDAHDLIAERGASTRTLVRLLESIADAATASGDYEHAIECYEAVLGAGGSVSAARTTSLWARLGEARLRWGCDSDAEAAFETALESLQDSPDLRSASGIYVGLAMVHGRRDQLDAAVDLADLALTFSGSDAPSAARAHQCLGALELQRGHFDDARTHSGKARDLWTELDSLQGVAAAANNLGMVHEATGDTDAAQAQFRVAVQQFEAVGNEHGLACALDNLALATAHAGDEPGAMEHLERAVEILSRIGMGDEGVVTAMWQAGSW